MEQRAEELVRTLQLAPHPEGGFYRELHRSPLRVHTNDGRERAALTTIYFLLPGGEVSRWHRVGSDEVWHHLEGAPLELFITEPDMDNVHMHTVGPLRAGAQPEEVVPPHHWQAARSTGAYTLVACVVGPGFDFADFTMLRDLLAESALLRSKQPAYTFLL